MDKPMKGIDTRLIHAGEPEPRIEGAVSMPIFQSSTFEYRGEESYYALRYIRLNNTPNHVALHAKLAAVEGAEAALVTASGMAAVATTLMTIAAAGDRIMAQDCLYGGTHDLMRIEFPRMNLGVDFVDGGNAAAWRESLTPQTRAIYVETISNPLMQVADLRAAVAFARAHGLVSIIDNTFASPVKFPAGGTRLRFVDPQRNQVPQRPFGYRRRGGDRTRRSDREDQSDAEPLGCVARSACMLSAASRVEDAGCARASLECERARTGAVSGGTSEGGRGKLSGLERDPAYPRARELFDGFGGMMSFELRGGVEAAEAFMASLTLPISAPSLGGVESLITRPVKTPHSGMPRAERERAGISEGLIRLSVGLEATADLMADFERALESY